MDGLNLLAIFLAPVFKRWIGGFLCMYYEITVNMVEKRLNWARVLNYSPKYPELSKTVI